MTMMPYYLRAARAPATAWATATIEDGILHLLGDPFSKQHMGITAENLAEKYEVSREAQDEYAMRSQERAARGDRRRQVQGRDRAGRSEAGQGDGDDRHRTSTRARRRWRRSAKLRPPSRRAAWSRRATPAASTTAPRRWS